MKKQFILIALFSLVCTFTQAQKEPFRGTGQVVHKNYNLKGFDKISFEDFDGTIEVEVGKPFSVRVEIDENLEPLLVVNKDEGENLLTLGLKNNYNGKLYLENTRIKIKVTLPEASEISHRGNTNVKVTGITGRYFKLETAGNGDVFLEGTIDELVIYKQGNGNIKAESVLSKIAKVRSYGNGNVFVNSQISLIAHGSGNCSVIQFGSGKIDPISGIIGNGSVRKN